MISSQPIVILSTGQSNIANTEPLAWTPPKNLSVWNWTGSDETTIGSAFLPADACSIGFAHSYAAEVARENPGAAIRLINIGRGDQAIAQWRAGASTPKMFDAVKANVEAALAVLGVDHVDRLLWWQGESDYMAGSETYFDDFEEVMTRFDNQPWMRPSTPVVIMGLSHFYNSGVMGDYNYELRMCADAQPDRRIFVDQTSLDASYWMPPTALHMVAEGYRESGRLAYHAERHGVTQGRKVDSVVRRVKNRLMQRSASNYVVDPGLQLQIRGGLFIKLKIVGCAGEGGFKWGILGPNPGHCYWKSRLISGAGSLKEDAGFGSSYPSDVAYGNVGGFILEIDLWTFGDNGRLKFKWAQQSDNANPSSVFSGSVIEAYS